MKSKAFTILGLALLCSCGDDTSSPGSDAGASIDASTDVSDAGPAIDTSVTDTGADSTVADIGTDGFGPLPPRLDGLVLEADGVVVPFAEGAFDPAVFAYEAEVEYLAREVTLTVSAPRELDTTLAVAGTPVVSGEPTSLVLALGDNELIVEITAIHTGITVTYALSIDRVDELTNVAYIKSDPVEPAAEFGGAIAMAGDLLVVGSEFETSSTGAENAGAAYIFERDGSTWTLAARVEPNMPGEDAHFGASVSTDGTRIVVGAPRFVGVFGAPAGAVYVFHKEAEWEESARIVSTPGVEFGTAVAIHGTRLVVGGGVTVSTAFAYGLDGAAWESESMLTPPARAHRSEFGNAIAMNEDTLVIAAFRENAGVDGSGGVNPTIEGTLTDSGAVYVYERAADGMSWVDEPTYLKAFSPQTSDGFGASLALDGDRLAIGAPGEDSGAVGVLDPSSDADDVGAPDSGAIYTFRRDAAGTWSAESYIKAEAPADADRYGAALAMWGNLLFVGVPGPISSHGGVSGYVHVDEWAYAASHSAIAGNPRDGFGASIAVSGHALVVGAPGEDGSNDDPTNNRASEAGAAYSFSSAP